MLRLPFAGHSRRQRPLSFSRSVALAIYNSPTNMHSLLISCPPCDAACHHLDNTNIVYVHSAVVQHRIDYFLRAIRRITTSKTDNKKNILSRRKNRRNIDIHIHPGGCFKRRSVRRFDGFPWNSQRKHFFFETKGRYPRRYPQNF